MAAESKANRNVSETMREVDGVRYFLRGEREVDGVSYQRAAIQTHFIERGEDCLDLFRRYVQPLYRDGDVVSVSEKVISMCQDKTVQMADVKVGFWAKFLSKFATSNNHGIGMDEPYKLQLAIDMKGLPRILWASICGGIARLLGRRGVFYEIAGQDVAGIDGFYSHSSFEVYHTMAVLLPDDPDGVCREIKETLGISCMLVDANDLNVEILGCSPDLKEKTTEWLCELIRDNPAGQDDELTPFVLVRPTTEA